MTFSDYIFSLIFLFSYCLIILFYTYFYYKKLRNFGIVKHNTTSIIGIIFFSLFFAVLMSILINYMNVDILTSIYLGLFVGLSIGLILFASYIKDLYDKKVFQSMREEQKISLKKESLNALFVSIGTTCIGVIFLILYLKTMDSILSILSVLFWAGISGIIYSGIHYYNVKKGFYKSF